MEAAGVLSPVALLQHPAERVPVERIAEFQD